MSTEKRLTKKQRKAQAAPERQNAQHRKAANKARRRQAFENAKVLVLNLSGAEYFKKVLAYTPDAEEVLIVESVKIVDQYRMPSIVLTMFGFFVNEMRDDIVQEMAKGGFRSHKERSDFISSLELADD